MRGITHPNHAGFTLVEMVTVILIMGILVVGVSSFIIFGTRIFVESSAVDQVLSQSRFSVERMTREIRSAVPNSARVSTATDGSYQCIELVPIAASTTYLDAPIVPDAASVNASVIATNEGITRGLWTFIYPLTDADVYAPNAGVNDYRVSAAAVAGDQVNITFVASIRFTQQSPVKRIYFANQPVSYCFERTVAGDSVDLKRYDNYGYVAVQPAPSAMGSGVLMAQNVVNNLLVEPAIVLAPSSLVTNAIVHIEPEFSVNGESFKYQHQVQVINVP